MRAITFVAGLTILFTSIEGKTHCGNEKPKSTLEKNCRYYLACLKNELFIAKCPGGEVFDDTLGRCVKGKVECRTLKVLKALKNHARQWEGAGKSTRKKRALPDAVGFFGELRGDSENGEVQKSSSGSTYLALLAAVPLIEMLIQYSISSQSGTTDSVLISTTTKPRTPGGSTVQWSTLDPGDVTNTPRWTDKFWTGGSATPWPYTTESSSDMTGVSQTPWFYTSPASGDKTVTQGTGTPWQMSTPDSSSNLFNQQDYQDNLYQDLRPEDLEYLY